jgi:hypothetical protein
VRVVVRNRSAQPIVPLSLELESAAGTLQAWGLEGDCTGDVRACSIRSAWASWVPARRRATGWELLLGERPATQQIAAEPDPMARAASERLVRVDPIAGGATIELDASVVAMYQHAGKLTARMRYAVVDPKEIALCAPQARPTTPQFVPCAPMHRLGSELHALQADWDHAAQTVTAEVELEVEHPAFDLDAARALAKLRSGRYGYDRRANQWILVEPGGQRTEIVSADGKLVELPGDWLEQLLVLDDAVPLSIFWDRVSAKDAAQIVERARTAGLDVAPFSFKGREEPDRLIATVRRGEVDALAALVRAFGYRMTADGIAPK